jgi:hypothetical protein
MSRMDTGAGGLARAARPLALLIALAQISFAPIAFVGIAFAGILCPAAGSVGAGTANSPDVVDPIAILRQADRARGNVQGVGWQVEIESREGERVNRLTVAVKARGYDFLGEELDPPKYKGQKLLMVSGNMWFAKPGLSKPIPISRRQRLMGEAAHGDIAATNYADEYDASIVGDEVVAGEKCLVFDLRARDKKPTYDRIRYWISRERQVGVRAEYFTVSGKLIKSALMEYAPTRMADGVTRPFITKIVITDALAGTNVTSLAFRNPRFGAIPDEMFNVNLFGR